MKVRPVFSLTILCTLMVSGCSSLNPFSKADDGTVPSPTPAVKNPVTIATASKLTSPPTIDLPPWYVKAPPSTREYLFLAGTGISNDLAMSRQKALLDAHLQLSDMLNGALDAITRQRRQDMGGDMATDSSNQTIRKRIFDTSLTGWYLEDTKTMAEDKKYRTFVLIRYPMGDANRLLKQRLQHQHLQSSELDTAIDTELSKGLNPANGRAVQ